MKTHGTYYGPRNNELNAYSETKLKRLLLMSERNMWPSLWLYSSFFL